MWTIFVFIGIIYNIILFLFLNKSYVQLQV